MKVKFYNFRILFSVAAILGLLSACSSSQVDETADGAPVETAEASDMVAATDEVPTAEDAPVAEDPSLASQEPMPAPEENTEAVANAQVDEAPAEAPGEAPGESLAEALLEAPADVQEAPVMETPLAEAPQNVEPAPVTESELYGSNSTSMPAPVVESTQDSGSVGGSSGGVVYRVKSGDTLMKISFENYGDLYRWREILEANRGKITDPNHIPPGTELSLNGAGMVQIERNGEQYLIKRGDTLGTISKDVYGTPRKWKRLWENNRQLIKDPNKIYAGFYLYYVSEGRLTGVSEPESGAAVSEPNVQEMPTTDTGTVENPDTRVPASN